MIKNGTYTVRLCNREKVTLPILDGKVHGKVIVVDDKYKYIANYENGVINGRYLKVDMKGKTVKTARYIMNECFMDE